ncbi:hypothetical protein BJ741DRAFT_675386 [Chytriomyces cf. hyalinus JEL632]|nr:hypothetical protein BJ741DRAFT_675386 [Chytriomyces cf. hyalinus JEL632]
MNPRPSYLSLLNASTANSSGPSSAPAASPRRPPPHAPYSETNPLRNQTASSRTSSFTQSPQGQPSSFNSKAVIEAFGFPLSKRSRLDKLGKLKSVPFITIFFYEMLCVTSFTPMSDFKLRRVPFFESLDIPPATTSNSTEDCLEYIEVQNTTEPYSDEKAIPLIYKNDRWENLTANDVINMHQASHMLVHFAKHLQTQQLKENYWDYFPAHFAHLNSLPPRKFQSIYSKVKRMLKLPADVDDAPMAPILRTCGDDSDEGEDDEDGTGEDAEAGVEGEQGEECEDWENHEDGENWENGVKREYGKGKQVEEWEVDDDEDYG